jgi:hypothetical protein
LPLVLPLVQRGKAFVLVFFAVNEEDSAFFSDLLLPNLMQTVYLRR